MTTTTSFDDLLAPISESAPCGDSLEFDGMYDAIREARREDDQELPQGIWETDRKRADWGKARDLARQALKERSKDLQIAAWLLEAAMYLDGFGGLRAGLGLICDLCERYWDGLHPLPVDDDMEFRLAPMLWLNEKLSIRIRLLPITRPATGDGKSYSLADLEMARWLENLARKNPRAAEQEANGAATMAVFNASAMLTTDEFFRALERDTSASLLLLDRLGAILAARCGNDAPSLQKLRRTVEEIRLFATSILRDRRGEDEGMESTNEPLTEQVMDMSETTGGTDLNLGARVPIRSRDEAYALLSTIADYLMRVEPHSPAPYLVKRAVTWGSMPLATLLQELVGENRELLGIYQLLGMDRS